MGGYHASIRAEQNANSGERCGAKSNLACEGFFRPSVCVLSFAANFPARFLQNPPPVSGSELSPWLSFSVLIIFILKKLFISAAV